MNIIDQVPTRSSKIIRERLKTNATLLIKERSIITFIVSRTWKEDLIYLPLPRQTVRLSYEGTPKLPRLVGGT